MNNIKKYNKTHKYNSKNKLNNKKSWFFKLMPHGT